LDVVTLATYLIKIDNSQIQEIYNGNFNDILNNLVTYIHPDDFIKMSKSHSLKKMISDDNVSSFIYRSKFFNAENDYQWIKTTIKSYQEGETKYKLLISELVEEEQNVKQEIEFNDIVYRHLSDDYVVYLVSKYHHDDIITYRNDEYFKIKNANKSFKDSIKKFIDKYLIDEDKVYLYENFNDFSIKNDLVNTSCFSLTIRLKNNYEMIYGQLEIKLFIHDNQTYVVFGIKNIDHLIKNIELSQIKLQNELLQSQLENKEKNDFFSNMSHDIRTSMNAIKGFSTLAIGSTDSNTTNDYLRKVIFSTDYLLNQFNNVLDISKMQSHKMVLNEKKENLANIFHEFKIVITPDILLKNLHFKMDVVNVKFDEVYCDKLRINQILFNLVSNAIKYTPEGGHIELILTQIDNNLIGYGTYQIMVKDDGIGISQEYIDHIFEPYVRENSDIVKGIHGTGLGMAITKNIVDMMKGNIKIESTLQKGSTFLVTFNLRYVENQNDLEILSLKQDANALIICSNAIDGENVASLFSLIGIKGEYAIDDEKIIELLESHNESNPYDFVIFDRSCTNINIIHQVKKNHQTYVFYLKNEFEKENVIDEQYVDIYLEKPLFISDIKNALNNRNQTILEDIKKDDNINLPLFNKRILLVEDYDLNKEMATLMLEKLGAIVECADNGEMAYNLVKSSYKGYYSLILMDIQMPVMDGYLATKMIRNLPEHDLSSIIIIGMSANSSSEDITNAKLSGMNDYLLKPIDMGNLLNTLKKYL
jgi:signal transduction histidine kinase/ActR/RegA family two-component response regulator